MTPMAARREIWLVATLAAIAVAGLVLGGCAKQQEQAPAATIEPLGESEAQLGKDACKAYVEQICACAKSKPESAELAETCHMAPAKSSSLANVLEVNRTTSDPKERAITERTARRIIKSCIESQSELLAKGCRQRAKATP